MIAAAGTPGSAYFEMAGGRLAATLRGRHVVVIAGDDSAAAALVALGIGRTAAAGRRVTIADLAGGAEPLETLAKAADPHGISDCFEYGISLHRVECRIDDAKPLFLLRTGIDPHLTDDILRHRRWSEFVDRLRPAGGLLVVIAPADASAVESLLTWALGVILVGRGTIATPENVLGRVRGPRTLESQRWQPRSPSHTVVAQEPWRVATLCAAALVLMGIAWLARSNPPTTLSDTAVATERAAAVLPPDPVGLLPAPADSLHALTYGIEALAVTTETGALQELQRMQPIGAGTVAPSVAANGMLWYRVVLGACATERAADSLLGALQSSGAIDAKTDRVVQVPYALILGHTTRDSADRLADSLRGRGVAAYSLAQEDGRAKVYVGAFSTGEEAAIATSDIRTAGIPPRIEFRTGRSC